MHTYACVLWLYCDLSHSFTVTFDALLTNMHLVEPIPFLLSVCFAQWQLWAPF